MTGVSPVAGRSAGGITLTITGTGFTGATQLDFGTIATTDFTIDSDTQITVVSPPAVAATVDVTVATPGGTSPVSSADQFTYAVGLP